MTTEIDREEAIRLIEEAVKIKGERHIQRECVYIEDLADEKAKPGCIVGTALVVKFDLDTISGFMDEGRNTDTFVTLIPALESELDMSFTDGALDVFDRAQAAQDGRFGEYAYNLSWGEALEHAREC